MQIEHKLQVATVALLLSLIAIAGPANSQLLPSNPEDCLDGDPFPLDATCANADDCLDGDPVPVDPSCAGSVPVTPCEEGVGIEEVSCEEDPTACADPSPADCIPEGGEPCTEGELGVSDPACVPDPLACAGETPPFVDGCVPPQTPCGDDEIGLFAPACTADPAVQEQLDDLVCETLLAEDFVDVADNDLVTCVQTFLTGTVADAQETVDTTVNDAIALLAPTVTVTAPASGIQNGEDFDVDILVEAGAFPGTVLAQLTVDAPTAPDVVVPLTLVDGAATYSVTDAEIGVYTFTVDASYEEDATELMVAQGSDSTTVAADPAPIVSAGADFDVDEGQQAVLDGTVSDDDSLTLEWTCDPVQTLASSIAVDTSFTAPLVSSAGETIDCTLEANDGQTTSSDTVTITVNNVLPDLAIGFAIDTLANQDIGDAVLVTGTATANQDWADAAISIDVVGTPAGSGNQNIVWSDGDVSSIDLAESSPESFEAQLIWDTFETVTYEITVAGMTSTFDVTYDETATYIGLGAGNPAAVLSMGALSSSSYAPDNTNTQDVDLTITVTDNNGAGDGNSPDDGSVIDNNLAAAIANGDDEAPVAVTTPGVNQVVGPGEPELARDFAASVTLPARLKDGTYSLEATYVNPVAIEEDGPAALSDSVSRNVAVDNVAPIITVTSESFGGVQRIAGIDSVDFSIDDFNAGTLEGTDVVELTSLALAVHEANAGACDGDLYSQGLTLDFPTAAGGIASGASLDLSEVAFSAPLDVEVSLAWATTALAGNYELCATLSDGALEHANVLLATFTLDALNQGFHLTIDDGGDGLAAPGVDPGETTSTDTMSVVFSGTVGASDLVLSVGTFQRNSGALRTFTAQDLSGKLCLTVACAGDDLVAEVDAVNGVVTFPTLETVALPGVELFISFSFTVPLGTASGNYAAPITVAGVEAV